MDFTVNAAPCDTGGGGGGMGWGVGWETQDLLIESGQIAEVGPPRQE